MLRNNAIWLAGTLAASFLAGCGGSQELTQVLLEVDTDITFPATIDEIRATIRSPSGETRVASAVLGFGQEPPPRSIAITHGGMVYEGYEVDLDGLSRGVVVVSRHVVFDMVRHQLRRAEVSLDQACVGVPCPDTATCSAGMCVAPSIGTSPLTSTPTPSDAGVPMSDVGP